MVAWGRILLNPVMKYQPRSLKTRQPPPLASTIQTILISEQYEVGDFESQAVISTVRPPNWTEEGWLKWRTDKFIAVGEGDAKKIVAGLRGK
jgi:hypothetical protein